MSAVTFSRWGAIFRSLFSRSPRVSARPGQRERLMRHISCWSGSWISDDFLSGYRSRIPPGESPGELREDANLGLWKAAAPLPCDKWLNLDEFMTSSLQCCEINPRLQQTTFWLPAASSKLFSIVHLEKAHQRRWKKRKSNLQSEPGTVIGCLKNSTGVESQQTLWVYVCHDVKDSRS